MRAGARKVLFVFVRNPPIRTNASLGGRRVNTQIYTSARTEVGPARTSVIAEEQGRNAYLLFKLGATHQAVPFGTKPECRVFSIRSTSRLSSYSRLPKD